MFVLTKILDKITHNHGLSLAVYLRLITVCLKVIDPWYTFWYLIQTTPAKQSASLTQLIRIDLALVNLHFSAM